MRTTIVVALLVISISQNSAEGPSKLKKDKQKLLELLGDTLKTWYRVTEKERNTKYDCPTSPFFSQTAEPNAKKCSMFLDCIEEDDRLCCYWSSSQTSHCLKGILKEEHPGECPTLGPWNDACLADYSGCSYDSECSIQSEKCCEGLCGYNECLNIRQNLGCPNDNDIQAAGESCTRDDSCDLDEKCCGNRGSKTCQSAVDISQRPGFCAPSDFRTHSECSGVTQNECSYDSECPTGKKCCSNGCGFNDCTELPFKKEVNGKDEKSKLIELLEKALRDSG